MILAKSIEPAFNGELVTIKVDKHDFDVRPVFGPQSKVKRSPTSIKVENYFRHRIAGKDDRIHYLLEAHKGKLHRARLVTIEYRGLSKNEVVQVGADVVGAAKGGKVTSALVTRLGSRQVRGIDVSVRIFSYPLFQPSRKVRGKVALSGASSPSRTMFAKVGETIPPCGVPS